MRKSSLLTLPLLLAAPFYASAEIDRIAPGTEITVRTNEPIEIQSWDRGRIYRGQIARDVYATDGDLAFPRGSDAELIVRQIGDHDMVIDLEAVYTNSRRFVVDASSQDFNTRGRPGVGGNNRTAKYVGGGAIIGSIIGAIAGGGKGAAIGAAAGAASGAGAQTLTRGREIHIPPESLLTFRLERTLQYVEGPDNGYNRDGRHYHDYRDYRDNRNDRP